MAEPNGVNRWTGLITVAAAIASVLGSMLVWTFNLQDRVTKIEVSQNEIETQFCAQDQVRNLMHANDLRNLAVIWEKQFGTPYPLGTAYYPTTCNRKIKQ